MRVFLIFSEEACKLGKLSGRDCWPIDLIDKRCREFLRVLTIEAGYETGVNTDRIGEREYEKSRLWQKYHDGLLKLAKFQAAKGSGDSTGPDDADRERAFVSRAKARRTPELDPKSRQLRGAEPRKGNIGLLEGKEAVSFKTGETYLGITARQRQKLTKDGVLVTIGGGSNKKVTTESLRRYLPPENPK